MKWIRERIPIGEITEGDHEPGALIAHTAEWVNPYAGLSDEQKEQMMLEVEPPFTTDSVERTEKREPQGLELARANFISQLLRRII